MAVMMKEKSVHLSYTVDDAINVVEYGTFQRCLILLAGLAWTADACEIIILSTIGQILACHWHIYRWQTALLTTAVFLGMMIGSPVYGIIADKYGRRKSVAASVTLMFVFGAISAAAPSYYWILAFRALTGFSLGGVPQLMTLTCEYCPVNMRGKAGFYLCYFWGVGTILIILLSWVIMIRTENWRILVAVAAVPALLVVMTLVFQWVPESVRFYLATNQVELAEQQLLKVAKVNRKELPPGELLPWSSCEGQKRGRIRDLLTPQFRKSTLLFWYMWVATAFCYYSIALISPIIIQHGNVNKIPHSNVSFLEDLQSLEQCVHINNEEYISLLWTSAAELPFLIIFTFLIDVIDRNKLMCGSCLVSGVLVFLLLLDVKNYVILIFLFGARGIILSVFQLTLLMTSEAFPTSLRAIAMGTGSAFCRLGGFMCPFVSQVLIMTHPYVTISILGVVIGLAGVAAILLPFETRGKNLFENTQ